MLGNNPFKIKLTEKTGRRYVLFLLVVISCLLPSYFVEKMPNGTLSILMVFSMMLMMLHIIKHGATFNVPIVLVVLVCATSIFSTFLNGGAWRLAIVKNSLVIIECLFLIELIKRENEIDTYLTVIRDITLIFAVLNMFVGIVLPQGFSSVGYNSYLFGNINGTMRSIMPGICCSLLIDAKKGKRFSFVTIVFFLTFYYFCFGIYFMATSFVGLLTIIFWVSFRNTILNNYKKAYLAIIIVVMFIEFFVVFLFGNSEYGTLLAGLFTMKQGFSGREALWVNIMNYIPRKKFLGYGLLDNELMESFIGNSHGSHNYYLDVVFQRGLIGLIPLLLLFFLPLLCRERKISKETCTLLGVCSSYFVMFLMEPFIGTEMLHLPIFCITMSLLMKSKRAV